MDEFNDPLSAICSGENGGDAAPSAYHHLNMLSSLVITACVGVCVLAKLAESNNTLHYDNFFARALAGYLKFVVNLMHTTKSDLNLPDVGPRLLAIGPHKTSLEAVVVASKIGGSPPRFFATDSFNVIPGIESFMGMFKVIPVASKPDKKALGGRSANEAALDIASNTLKNDGCVALLPQGNFARIGEDPHRVYGGVAKLAIKTKTAIHVLRLDGFWSLQNSFIPLFIKNHRVYRAFISALHPNDVRVTECCVIDIHLGENAQSSSEEELMEEICAQLYAFYRHTDELSIEQIARIKEEINSGGHLVVWRSKLSLYDKNKSLELMKTNYSNDRKTHQILEGRFFAPMANAVVVPANGLASDIAPSLEARQIN